MTFENSIKYLENLKLEDKVLDSIINKYNSGKELTEKQKTVITKNYFNHITAQAFFSKKRNNLTDFQKSLKEQFESKGFLTEKQVKYLV